MHLQHEVVCPTIIGRDEEFESLRRVLAHAREGNGRVALIVGEAGVGKSRLLRAMTDEARAAGFFVMQGACFEAERTIPYAPLLDLVRLFASSAPSAIVGHVLEPAASDLVAMFPELKPLLPDATPRPSVDPESDRRRLFHVLAQTVTLLARKQPVFLSFEDVHWSDDATLELVFHLARSHASQPLVITLTYRGEEAGPRLARLVADLERARLVSDFPLGRLGRDQVGAMLAAIFGPGDQLGADFVHVLHGLTEGNPFFVEETLKSLILAGDLAPTDRGSWRARPLERVRVPRTAVEAVRRRLATLTVPARAVASMAAIAGRRFDFDLLQSLTQHNEVELLALVKELISAQLVIEESAERFAFRHALTREAIYAELLARERVALHRAIAAALERQHADSLDAVIEALAYHAWESGEWQRAAEYAARAARHALALSAPREAVAHLDRAFAALERSGARPELQLYIDRGRANETLGEFQRANDDFSIALARARDSGNARTGWEGEALLALGMLWSARDYNRAGDYRREALAVARTLGDESLLARSLNRVGNWYVNREEPRAGLPYHLEGLAIVERLADRAGIAETVDLIAMAHHCAGDEPASSGHYARSVALFTANGDRRGLANALALLSLCGPSYHSSSTTPFTSTAVDEELRNLRAVRLARDIGWRAGEAFVRFVTADCLMWRGDYARAIPLVREALALAREIDHLEWTAGSLRLLGAISLDLLDVEGACERLEAAHAIARRLDSHVWIRWTAAPLAIARGRAGDAARALELIESASRVAGADAAPPAGPESPELTLGERQLWLARAEVALGAGDPGRALSIVDARLASENAAAAVTPLGVPRLLLVRAEALTELGRYDDANDTLDDARRTATAQGARPMLWRIEGAAGRLHRAQRQRLEARKAFDRARSITDELATQIPDDQLRGSFLAGLGSLIPSGPQPSAERAARDALGGLTRRERDVAELVAQGKANRVIARELGIGERTVEGYVTSALAKLDLTSRTQLATWAIEKGVGAATAPRSKR